MTKNKEDRAGARSKLSVTSPKGRAEEKTPERRPDEMLEIRMRPKRGLLRGQRLPRERAKGLIKGQVK